MKPIRTSPLDGQGFVLNVNKEASWTSHDVVARIRRILNFRKVGHTGTLDPFATGVLVCCVGRGTKLSNTLMNRPKEYLGSFYFGRTTDSGDCTGETLREWEIPMPTLEQMREKAATLTGEIDQVPPMVSAIRHEGTRLYKLARQGITVERKARKVFIKSFEIQRVEDRVATFRVRCSKGTYIRTLIEDLATRLDGGAYVETLCRSQVGAFKLANAVRLTEEMTTDELLSHTTSMGDAVSHLPPWQVPSSWTAKLRRGQVPPWAVLKVATQPRPGDQGRLVSRDGDLLALATVETIPGPLNRNWFDALSLKLTRVI
jgi:tRNA pseudouridine55 synthase